MDQEHINLILLGIAFVTAIMVFILIILVYKLFKMHDVRNEDGQYAWMVPAEWGRFAKQISDSQVLIVQTVKPMAENIQVSTNLLRTIVDEFMKKHESERVKK